MQIYVSMHLIHNDCIALIAFFCDIKCLKNSQSWVVLEGGNPNARHHGKGLERATFCHDVELSYCLVTVRALTETWYQECEQTLIILLLSI